MGYPAVYLFEECMREGMQIESAEIATTDKIRLLDALSQTGLKAIVVGSFVSPQVHAADGGHRRGAGRLHPARRRHVHRARAQREGPRARRRVHPTARRGEARPRCCRAPVRHVLRRNVDISRDEEIARWPGIVAAARAAGAEEAGIAVNAAFGSNFEGPFSSSSAWSCLRREHALWDEAGSP